MCFLFSLQRLSEAVLILRRNERDMIKKCVLVFMSSTRYSCPILMTLEYSRQILKKNSSDTKFTLNPSSGSRVVPSGRTDGQT